MNCQLVATSDSRHRGRAQCDDARLFSPGPNPDWIPSLRAVSCSASRKPGWRRRVKICLPTDEAYPASAGLPEVVSRHGAWALAIIAFAVLYQQIETCYFTSWVSKKTIDVNPAIALAAVFVGGAIWGP